MAATVASAGEFSERLLALKSRDAQRELIANCDLPPAEAHAAGMLLIDAAEGLLNVELERVEAIAASVLALAERTGDGVLEAMAWLRQGNVLEWRGRNAEALALYNQAMAALTRLGRPVEAARIAIPWVVAATRLGRVREALQRAREARRVLVEHGQLRAVIAIDANVGNLYREHGSYGPALRCYTDALALSRSRSDDGARLAVARCLVNRGLTLVSLGRHREALTELQEARTLHEALGQSTSCARADLSIGLAHLDLGHYREALTACERAQSTFHKLGLTVDATWASYATADCYLRLNRPTDALAALAAGDADAQGTDSALYSFGTASRRVIAHMLLGEESEALAVLDRAERDAPGGALQHKAWLAAERARILLGQGAARDADAAARRAHTLARRCGERRIAVDALIVQGHALLTSGRMDDAERVITRAHRVARSLGAAPLLSRTNELLARIAETQGRPRLAIRRYTEAVRQLEREQLGVIFQFRGSFAEGRTAAYEHLAALQLQSGRPVEAWTAAERAKSRALTDAIAGRVEIAPHGSAEARRLGRELARARGDYAAAFAQVSREEAAEDGPAERTPAAARALARYERRIARLLQQLQASAGPENFIELYGGPVQVTLPALDAGTTLVEFFFSGANIIRFQVDGAGVRGEVLAGEVAEVERLVRALRLNLASAAEPASGRGVQLASQARRLLQTLYEHLLGGLDGLDACRALVVVPHGPLHYLPFAALFDGERYLIESRAVSYAPSATLYQICRHRAGGRRARPLIMAHSAGGRLRSAIREAEQVAQLLGSPVYTDDAATRGLLESRGRTAGMIHIAAHGRFRADAPLFSSIDLADGPLTTADILNLKLRAGLVTLSACETGRSTVGGGDELDGLSRAFLYAGASSLLVSQWRVEDDSTSVLMARFYSELRRGAGRAEALRAAQLEAFNSERARRFGQHPFHWAGFQLIGDDRGMR